MQVVLLDKKGRQRVVVEEEVGLVDEAHVGRLFPGGEHLPADVERPQLHVLAGPGGVGLAPVVRHHLVFGRPHAQVVNHLETRGDGEETKKRCNLTDPKAFTCRTSWLEAKIISLRAGGGILSPSLKARDIMAPWKT